MKAEASVKVAMSMSAVFEIEAPIRIESAPNLREHWSKRHRRAVKQDDEITYLLIGSRPLLRLLATQGPLQVTLTRIGPRRLDDDNCIAGFKAVRDAIARLLDVNDGDASRVTWVYGPQEKARTYGTRVRIEGRP